MPILVCRARQVRRDRKAYRVPRVQAARLVLMAPRVPPVPKVSRVRLALMVPLDRKAQPAKMVPTRLSLARKEPPVRQDIPEPLARRV